MCTLRVGDALPYIIEEHASSNYPISSAWIKRVVVAQALATSPVVNNYCRILGKSSDARFSKNRDPTITLDIFGRLPNSRQILHAKFEKLQITKYIDKSKEEAKKDGLRLHTQCCIICCQRKRHLDSECWHRKRFETESGVIFSAVSVVPCKWGKMRPATHTSHQEMVYKEFNPFFIPRRRWSLVIAAGQISIM